MCVATEQAASMKGSTRSQQEAPDGPPLEKILQPPTLLARSLCASVLVGIGSVWAKYAFVDDSAIPGCQVPLHHWTYPLSLTALYLVSLPLLRVFSTRFLSNTVDAKALLRESMILYNAGQVLINLWTVYRILDALVFQGHPFISGPVDLVDTGATYAVWVHYCDKYLEFFDTYFMVLRGKMDQVSGTGTVDVLSKLSEGTRRVLLPDFALTRIFATTQQVSFLHVYHHTSIAWAWWLGLKLYPGGDIYFGALINSWIHVMMYSYYTLSLLKIRCPWKKYLTQAQLLQFVSVVVYSSFSMVRMPDGATWRHYLAYSVQVFEMVSLFVLFLFFYRKAYSSKKTKSLEEQNEQSAENDTTSSDSLPEQGSVTSQSSDEK